VNALLDDLTWRGLLANSTDLEALTEALDGGSVRFYVGFDPTAASLHIGHLVQLLTARRLQLAGHRPVLLVGGATGLIGDPKAAGERPMQSKDVVEGWVDRLKAQVSRFVDFDGPSAAIAVNNLDWTASMTVVDFLRDIGKHFPVNRMLAREVVSSRLESGISYTEFSYVLLQSNDYLNLFRQHGVTLQLGGSDQWGNITAGVELIRRADGARVHAVATPLITKADGTKFGKSDGGAPWLDPRMFSPYGMHQLLLNVEDSKVIDYLKCFTFRTREEIEDLARRAQEEPWKREAQRVLAADVVDMVHGVVAREGAERAAEALFGKGELTSLDESTLAGVATEIGGGTCAEGESLTIVEALLRTGLSDSRSAARRAIDEGGAYVNNERIADPEQAILPDQFLHGRYAILRRGRKNAAMLTVQD
jgi:tyrosyl-tRNA synthetase